VGFWPSPSLCCPERRDQIDESFIQPEDVDGVGRISLRLDPADEGEHRSSRYVAAGIMTTHTVVGVRKVFSDDFSHRHIVGVCTDDRVYHSVRVVVESIGIGDNWRTKVGGFEEAIKVLAECPAPGCTAAPYIETTRRSPRKENLENLPLC
jgi:hypothetical protein